MSIQKSPPQKIGPDKRPKTANKAGYKRYPASRRNQHIRSRCGIAVHPRQRIFQPQNRMMDQRMFQPHDATLRDHAFMHEIV